MASLNLNKVILCGNITGDPELRQTQSGTSVTSFTIAVNRRFKAEDGKQQTDFIPVVAWKGTAEFVSKYFRKGSSICVSGSIQTRQWTDQNGGTRYATEVIADEAYFVDSKAVEPSEPIRTAPVASVDEGVQQRLSFQTETPKFSALTPDEDLPF